MLPFADSLLSSSPDPLPNELYEAVSSLLVSDSASPPVVKYTPELPQVIVFKAVTHVVSDEATVACACFLDLLLIVPLCEESKQELISPLEFSN